jgi:hypothetical protein
MAVPGGETTFRGMRGRFMQMRQKMRNLNSGDRPFWPLRTTTLRTEICCGGKNEIPVHGLLGREEAERTF